MATKPVQTYLNPELYKVLSKQAKSEKRSLSQMIVLIIERHFGVSA